MSEQPAIPQLDPNDFKLSDYDGLTIVMPKLPTATEEDIDAQLFSYIASSGQGASSKGLSDLDDEWVKENFGGVGITTLKDLRISIRSDLNRQSKAEYENLKFRTCSEAVAARLEGEIPADVLDANVEASRGRYEQQLRMMGTTKVRYMRDEHLTEEQYEQRVRDDVAFQLKLNMALDKMVEATTMTVPNSELTEYLACEDPEQFLTELRESGRVEEARQAASRVKMMRRLVETAVIEVEGGDDTMATKDECRDASISAEDDAK